VSPRRALLVGIAVVAAGISVAAGLAHSAGTHQHKAWPSGCPRHPVASFELTAAGFTSAAKSVRAQIPRVYKRLSSMGDPAWPHAIIEALVSTAGTPTNDENWPRPLGGVDHYATIAKNTCGATVESASLVAFLYFPACQIPCDSDFAYVTRTRRGWRLWTSHSEG
jgi:hypothetical protein